MASLVILCDEQGFYAGTPSMVARNTMPGHMTVTSVMSTRRYASLQQLLRNHPDAHGLLRPTPTEDVVQVQAKLPLEVRHGP